MPTPPKLRAEPWLQAPLRTAAGELQLAGVLHNIAGIDPGAMRVLGSYVIVLMVSGRGYYCDANGLRRELAAGDAVVVFPDLAHAYGPQPGEPWTQVYVVFAGAQFDLWRQSGLLRPERPVLRVGGVDYWQQRLRAVAQGGRGAEATAALRAFGQFLQVLADMVAADADAARPAAHDAWLARSLQLLGAEGGRSWPAPQVVAREVGLSYENFRKRFVQLTGESPGQFQKRRRLERACAAIYQGGVSIKQIAAELGFCDVFHFSKAFKQVLGMTPTEYRRRATGAVSTPRRRVALRRRRDLKDGRRS